MDFYQIRTRSPKAGVNEVYPEFLYRPSKDLMVRGGAFYAVWDEEQKIWSTNEFDVQRLIDADLRDYYEKNKDIIQGIRVLYLSDANSGSWDKWKKYTKQSVQNYIQLDEKITFLNQEVRKEDYVSKKVPYPLEEGSHDAYDKIMDTLYNPAERDKLEWAVGSIFHGDSKFNQKLFVLYGEMGSGKSTFLNILQKLVQGYYTTFDAKALGSRSNQFAMESFRYNPLVAIQHDGDLSRIEDNTRLNSIISHEEMEMNEKFKSSYDIKFHTTCFMGSNSAVKISDSRSGLIRRLIDINPSLRKLPTSQYHSLMSQIDFELGAIAYHCLQKYLMMGKNYYATYRPISMMFKTDVFFNFVEENYHVFKGMEGIKLQQAYEMYKAYCEEALVEYKLPKYKFREELKSYFFKFHELYETKIDGQRKQIRSWYERFLHEKFETENSKTEESVETTPFVINETVSQLDVRLRGYPAQYASSEEKPLQAWDSVTTTLVDIDTNQIHYVRPPQSHIVIDFDLKDAFGDKSLELNMDAASKWPITYAEISKGGNGIHLHYIYDGDVSQLSRVFSEDIEIKVFTGKSSLRRKLTKCRNAPIATLNSGLPLKGGNMVNFDAIKSEKGLRTLIIRNLRKEIHPGTKPSIDFIYKILDDAYKSGLKYDVSDMRPDILQFATSSTNQADYCIKLVSKMKFASEEPSINSEEYRGDEYVFFDVEVFPNLFIVVYKMSGRTKVKLINPTPAEIEPLLKMRIIGFNCRRYDNHILYARYIGYDNQALYELSQKIISGSRNAMFGEAYNISYTDVYDFASAMNKKGLKKWEIELGIHHQELNLPWDEEVPKERWEEVADYCGNDVEATEIVFYYLSGDWAARQILAALSGLTVNDSTNSHSVKIVFGKDKNTQSCLEYTDLSELFLGYTFDKGKSLYRGIEPGEGGYVYAEPGMYEKVAVLDVASMHPTSIIQLNLFGKYTKNFKALVDGRLAIKHKDFDTLETLLDGKLIPFIRDAMGENPQFSLKDVSNGLKTAINSAYGLTSAKFDNPFRDSRNIDNIVAKRGALFMIDLQHAVQEQGFIAAHIKTDSIKIPNATPEIIKFVFDFGKKYGYDFEHEDTMQRFCLVNNAVYVCRHEWGEWDATGAQFAHPYVFKTLFSKESIEFKDLCETKSVNNKMFLDMNENLSDDEHNYQFVGKVGSFCPMLPGVGGGILLREKEGKYYAVSGTKGYRWMEATMVKTLELEKQIDISYFNALVDTAIDDISKHGDWDWFISDDPGPKPSNDPPPWESPCGKQIECMYCTHLTDDSTEGFKSCAIGYDISEIINLERKKSL